MARFFRFFPLVLVLALCLSLCAFPVLADDVDGGDVSFDGSDTGSGDFGGSDSFDSGSSDFSGDSGDSWDGFGDTSGDYDGSGESGDFGDSDGFGDGDGSGDILDPDSVENPDNLENPDDLENPDNSHTGGSGASNLGGGGLGFASVTCRGSNVKVDVQRHDTLAVTSSGPELYSLYSDSDGSIKAVVRSLFGEYTPRTQLVTTYYDGVPVSTDEQVTPGLGGLDWEWIASVVLFALVLWCLFRLLGGVVSRG